jgi:hypothetical protein
MAKVPVNPTALVAAAQASEALAEILRFMSEGRALPSWAFDPERNTVSLLAEALRSVAEIEIEDCVGEVWADDRQDLERLIGACTRFLERDA